MIILQFDSLSESEIMNIRGIPLLEKKLGIIDMLNKYKIPVYFFSIMIKENNLKSMGDLVTYFKKYKALYGKQYERLVIVQGDEGTPEIVKDCKIMVIDNDEITQEIKIKLEDFGINYERSKELISRDKMAYDLKYPKEDFIKLAKLNTALLLLASKQTNNIQQTFKKLISI